MTPEAITVAGRNGFLLTGSELLTGIFAVSAVLIIAFLLRMVISQWVAFMMLKMLRPFRTGDTISTAWANGVVESMGALATVLTTADNTTVFLPNRELVQTSIFNHTAKASRRITIGFNIASDEDIEAARDIIEEALDKNPRILAAPAFEVLVVDYFDDDAVLLARFWTSANDWEQVRSEAMVSILGFLRAEGIRSNCFRDTSAYGIQVGKINCGVEGPRH